MLTKFDSVQYRQELHARGAADRVFSALDVCIADEIPRFEAASRSVSMLCHSIKMGMPQKVGSKLENAGRLSDEINPLIAGYYFKRGELVITYSKKDGTECTVRHRPDCVRLLALPDKLMEGAFDVSRYIRFAEYKSSADLIELSKSNDRYQLDKLNGRWHCPVAEKAAMATYGFGYDVITEQNIDAVIVANVESLHAYFSSQRKPVSLQLVEAVRKVVSEKQGLSIAELMLSTPGLDSDAFHKLLVDQKLFVPLDACQLDLPATVHVFTDRLSYEAFGLITLRTAQSRLHVRSRFPQFVPGEVITIRGKNHTVVAPSNNAVQFRTECGDSTVMTRGDLERLLLDKQISSLGVPANPGDAARQILLSTPTQRLGPAVDRCSLLMPVLEGKARLREIRGRLPDAKKWLARARDAMIRYQNPLIGCIDKRSSQGWRGSHLSSATEKCIGDAIEAHYLTALAPTRTAAYGFYRSRCKEVGAPAVAFKTFKKRIMHCVADRAAQARAGSMAASAVEAPFDGDWHISAGGRHFMHVAHGDNFVFDLATVFPELGLPLGTAWVSALLDSHTRTVLAIVMTFESPSYVTTMMLLRECVHRWGRLPEVLFLDNGSEFKNLSLVLFAQYYGMEVRWRPPGKPRWGAEIERFIGTINQRLAGELPGATKVFNRLRRMSKTHQPEELAVFGLGGIAHVVRDWSHSFYDDLPHGGLHGKTPCAMRQKSIRDHGNRAHLSIKDDPLFPIISLPAPAGDGTAKVQAHNGVQVDNLYYWHDRFYETDVVGSYVQVRWDPFDITRVYAFVVDEWVECYCAKLLKLRRLSDEDLCAASLEIRKGRSDYYRDQNTVIERVATFLDGARKQGEERAHLLRTKESARQFLERTSPRLPDDDPPASTALSPVGGPSPRHPIAGLKA